MSLIHERITSEFKQLFKRLQSEGKFSTFDQILERVTGYLEIICPEETKAALQSWYRNIAEHAFLKELVSGERFEELVFFGQRFITKDGIQQSEIMLSDDDFILAWTQLAFDHHIAWNHAHPFASFAVKIDDLSTRITLIHPCCSPDNQIRVFVRAHSKTKFNIEDFCDAATKELICHSIEEKKNLLVVGATQSGKTTLMRAMLDHVSLDEHVVVLEDTHEIQRSAKRTTAMLADPVDPKRTLSEYCAMALRMSPDRIVLGEIRSKEVVPLLLAFNSGHRGGMSSLHADSVVDGLERLALLFHLYSGSNQLPHDKVMELVCRNIDLVVFVKNKQVTDIAKVIGSENGRPLFESFLEKMDVNKENSWWQ